jgi:branched-chain amino acid transport system ATP-binding protein
MEAARSENRVAAILIVKDATKSFGELRAVDRISFKVEEGEIYGIAGPNGAGKTTLFNLITSIPFHADSGKIAFRSRSIESLPPHEVYRLGVARTFQKETAFDTLTVEQNMRVGAVFGRLLARQARAGAISRALKLVDLDGVNDRIAGELPLYAKKRLMIASAIVSNPSLLMLDEPAAGLNPVELEQLDQLMLTLNDELGITIIIIEHVLPVLFGISHRVMVMDSGQRIAEGDPREVARDDTVIEAYLGERGKSAFHALTD